MKVSGTAEVVCSVNESFEGFIHATFRGSGVFVVASGVGELGAKKVFAVHEMNTLAGLEGGF